MDGEQQGLWVQIVGEGPAKKGSGSNLLRSVRDKGGAWVQRGSWVRTRGRRRGYVFYSGSILSDR